MYAFKHHCKSNNSLQWKVAYFIYKRFNKQYSKLSTNDMLYVTSVICKLLEGYIKLIDYCSDKRLILFDFGKCECLHTVHCNIDVNYERQRHRSNDECQHGSVTSIWVYQGNQMILIVRRKMACRANCTYA